MVKHSNESDLFEFGASEFGFSQSLIASIQASADMTSVLSVDSKTGLHAINILVEFDSNDGNKLIMKSGKVREQQRFKHTPLWCPNAAESCEYEA